MKNNRTFLEKLLDGAEAEWKPLWSVTTWDKRFNAVEKEKQPKVIKYHYYLASELKPLIVDGGDVKLLTTNESDIWTTEELVQSNISEGEIIAIPWGGNPIVQYYKGKFVTADNRIATSNNTKILDNKFLYYFLLSKLDVISSFYRGSGIKHPSMYHVLEMLIPIPPLPVQTEIVRILDALTALTSELTSELILRQKQYEYYRETLLSPDNLEQLNTGGAKKKLSDVVNIYLGLTYTPTYVENGVKFISAQNTSNDFLDLSNTKFISREEFEKSTSNAKPKRGDILFTRVGSNLGHPVIVDTDEDLCIFVSLGFLRAKDKNILNSYIKHWMNTNLFWKQVEKNVHGSAKVNLNTGWLKNFEIYIPPLKEQQRIVSILDKFETLTNSITEGLPLAIEQSQKRYEYYRELLLNFS